MAQQIMPLINDISQLNNVYIISNTESLDEEWTTKWQKIKSVHVNIDGLCEALQLRIKQYQQDSIAMSFITVKEMAPSDNLNQLDPTFMYTQLFKEALLSIEHNEQAIKDFITYCRHNDCLSPKYIDRFEKEYSSQLAIWWYTFPSNIYSMLNYGLRTLGADIIITMGFFLRHLHQQIQQLYEQQINSYGKKPFLVYRGQGLMKSEFEKLEKTKGGLMSFNNFLSTSTDKEVSLDYAECASTKPDTVGILFIMSIDPCIKSTPFASIKEESYFNEEDEILFSMHTVFRVSVIKPIDKKDKLYVAELQLTSDDDQQLRILTNRIREEASGNSGWERLGNLLLKIGQLNKAEELYNVLLEQTSDELQKEIYYNQLGYDKDGLGDYEKAIWYYKKGLEIIQNILPSNHPHLATSYNNIGNVYDSTGEYSKALSYYQKALEIQEKTPPSNHSHLAGIYNNIGLVCHNTGEYSKALCAHEKALEIYQKTLPPNHPHLATSYSNIAIVYDQLGEYPKALSYYEKALEIYQKTLPSNHPDLAIVYINIGRGYSNVGKYSKALSYYEKALETFQKTFPSNQPHLPTAYSNIASVYHEMGEYSKALSFYEKALAIYQKTLPSNHSNLAVLYNNIGSVYNNMKEYSKALSYYEKALEVRQKTLPSNHPLLATTYNNIGSVYVDMVEYSKAVSFYEKALGIFQKALPSNHPSLATSYNNIGLVYHHMEEYSKALSFYEKILEIREKVLPLNHPDLATSYNNIAKTYDSMEDYSKALSHLECALNICQCAFPGTHPDIKDVENGIEILKEKLLSKKKRCHSAS
ncbi:unnamed protein product [Adineta steineri]|uniref:NAD(P)(+)--arginine ADP-ribosyltransferase n=2 Tax=Adineta steineri TaxID=433720 RepID=A0A819W5C9_9BILA|nr:unnamed protein product [Adineta steineri]